MAHEQAVAWMREVLDLAAQNAGTGRGGPFAALVAQGDRVIARAVNRVTAEHDPTAHAEILAIREACQHLGTHQLIGCDVYCSCEPCPMCLGALYWARPDRVFYASTGEQAAQVGFDDRMIYEQLSLPPEQRKLPMVRVTEVDATRPFAVWADYDQRVEY